MRGTPTQQPPPPGEDAEIKNLKETTLTTAQKDTAGTGRLRDLIGDTGFGYTRRVPTRRAGGDCVFGDGVGSE
ncbi:unnamed protein product [Boreogadus saida]